MGKTVDCFSSKGTFCNLFIFVVVVQLLSCFQLFVTPYATASMLKLAVGLQSCLSSALKNICSCEGGIVYLQRNDIGHQAQSPTRFVN